MLKALGVAAAVCLLWIPLKHLLRTRKVSQVAKWRKAQLGSVGTGESWVIPKRWRDSPVVGGESLPVCKRYATSVSPLCS